MRVCVCIHVHITTSIYACIHMPHLNMTSTRPVTRHRHIIPNSIYIHTPHLNMTSTRPVTRHRHIIPNSIYIHTILHT